MPEMLEHPDITRVIRDGVPAAPDLSCRCPVCRRDADRIYIDRDGVAVACDSCRTVMDVYDWSCWSAGLSADAMTDDELEALPAACPICGEDCELVYLDRGGAVLGCDCCVTDRDAYAWALDRYEEELQGDLEAAREAFFND